jgi:hypothetical protein
MFQLHLQLNVKAMMNVHTIRPVKTRNVSTHATSTNVEGEQNVLHSSIVPTAFAHQELREIRSYRVSLASVSITKIVRTMKLAIGWTAFADPCATNNHVEQMLSARALVTSHHASAEMVQVEILMWPALFLNLYQKQSALSIRNVLHNWLA